MEALLRDAYERGLRYLEGLNRRSVMPLEEDVRSSVEAIKRSAAH